MLGTANESRMSAGRLLGNLPASAAGEQVPESVDGPMGSPRDPSAEPVLSSPKGSG